MYNPISRNVLRQALKWSGAPRPIAIGSAGPHIEATSGTVMAQNNLMFDRQALLGWAMLNCDNELLSNDAIIHCALQNCFCDDVGVMAIRHKQGERLQAVTVLCSITAKD